MLIFRPDWGLGGGFRIRIKKFWNSAVLYFCSVVKFHPYSTVLSFSPRRKTIFFSKWARLCVLYVTPRCGHCKTIPVQEAAAQSYTTPPCTSKVLMGGKVERNLLLLFKWCSHSLPPHGAQEGVETYFCPPPAPAPPFPASSLKSCSCVPLSKEAVILGRLHVSYTGQGEVITSSSHTAQSC